MHSCLPGECLRLSPDIRGAFGKLVKKGLAVTLIAELFDTTRQTVHRWLKRARHVGREYFKDKPRKPKPAKVTEQVELSILKLRPRSNGEQPPHTTRPVQFTQLHQKFDMLRSKSHVIYRDHKQRSCKEQTKRVPARV